MSIKTHKVANTAQELFIGEFLTFMSLTSWLRLETLSYFTVMLPGLIYQ